MNRQKALVWFRRDLRDHDHVALSEALARYSQVHCAFIFDTDILGALPSRRDRRVEFIRESLVELDASLRRKGGGLIVRHGAAPQELPKLARELGVGAVLTNRDYEPSAKLRDASVADALAASGIAFESFKDQVIFESLEVITQAGKPFSVFTPYKNAWFRRLTAADTAEWRSEGKFAPCDAKGIPSLADIGFESTDLRQLGIQPGMAGARTAFADFLDGRISRYGSLRDFPAVKGVSYLSVHFRFGTLSIREAVRAALADQADAWLNELIWRDFYFMILDQFPYVANGAFKPEFNALQWDDWPEGLAAWKAGRTGYPLVDAAMRQLAHSGWMHNRLRMVVASFLTKDLGIDWRLGERHFADQLNDFDLSANNGGWQWAASTGCDAQPWFRIFNPVTQSEKFDPEGRFIRRYIPELAKVPDKYIHAPWQMPGLEQQALGIAIGRDYPAPIVDHALARTRTLQRYESVKKMA